MSIDDKLDGLGKEELEKISKGFDGKMYFKDQLLMYRAGIKLTLLQFKEYCPTFYSWLQFSKLYKLI